MLIVFQRAGGHSNSQRRWGGGFVQCKEETHYLQQLSSGFFSFAFKNVRLAPTRLYSLCPLWDCVDLIMIKDRNSCHHFFFCPQFLCKCFALLLSQSHLPRQDDSDDEPPTAKRAHGHSDTLEFMDLSCEEGEETASSEVHSEVSHSLISLDCEGSFFMGRFLNLLFNYSGEWLGWQWAGFLQWWGRVE